LSPDIVSEELRCPKEVAPPKRARAHYWLPENEQEGVNASVKAGAVLDAYISKRAEARMRNHALANRDQNLEVMGFLLGEVRSWSQKDYVVVRDVATSDLDATLVSVRFDRDGFEKLFDNLDDSGFDYMIVGWYHSHPGYGCFLSEKDVETQTRMFTSPFHLAAVIDPKNFDIGLFKVEDGAQKSVTFAVYWDEHDDPYGGVGRISMKKD
jgi:26S proteasome regulatory subunit N11